MKRDEIPSNQISMLHAVYPIYQKLDVQCPELPHEYIAQSSTPLHDQQRLDWFRAHNFDLNYSVNNKTVFDILALKALNPHNQANKIRDYVAILTVLAQQHNCVSNTPNHILSLAEQRMHAAGKIGEEYERLVNRREQEEALNSEEFKVTQEFYNFLQENLPSTETDDMV